jgi:hypothetical protein
MLMNCQLWQGGKEEISCLLVAAAEDPEEKKDA